MDKMNGIIEIKNDIIFDAKASAVPYNYRISYKVSLICLIIGKCCGKKGCSSIKLQMINAAASSGKMKNELFEIIDNPFLVETTLIRFDPAISRAINLAIAENLIFRQANALYRLTEKGKLLVSAIYEDNQLMQVEKALFSELSNSLTEEIIERISSNWRPDDAKN